jgi:hypothetical protein
MLLLMIIRNIYQVLLFKDRILVLPLMLLLIESSFSEEA